MFCFKRDNIIRRVNNAFFVKRYVDGDWYETCLLEADGHAASLLQYADITRASKWTSTAFHRANVFVHVDFAFHFSAPPSSDPQRMKHATDKMAVVKSARRADRGQAEKAARSVALPADPDDIGACSGQASAAGLDAPAGLR